MAGGAIALLNFEEPPHLCRDLTSFFTLAPSKSFTYMEAFSSRCHICNITERPWHLHIASLLFHTELSIFTATLNTHFSLTDHICLKQQLPSFFLLQGFLLPDTHFSSSVSHSPHLYRPFHALKTGFSTKMVIFPHQIDGRFKILSYFGKTGNKFSLFMFLFLEKSNRIGLFLSSRLNLVTCIFIHGRLGFSFL